MKTESERHLFLEIATQALKDHHRARENLVTTSNIRDDRHNDEARKKSHKHAITALLFSYHYVESLLRAYGRAQLGRYYRDEAIFESKLQALEVSDKRILNSARELRLCKKCLIQGEPMELVLTGRFVDVTKNEAEKAVELAITLKRLFKD